MKITGDTIFAIIELIVMIAAVVLFFLGIKYAVDTIKADGESGSDKPKTAAALYKKSYLFIALAIVCYIITRFFANYYSMTAEGADTISVILQSLWEGVRNTGFLILLPFVLRKGRAHTIQR